MKPLPLFCNRPVQDVVNGSEAFSPSEREWLWKGYKPNSVCVPRGTEEIICLSGQYPEPGKQSRTGFQPVSRQGRPDTRGSRPSPGWRWPDGQWSATSQRPVLLCALERAAPRFPIWPCTRWGFPCLRACAWSGGLLPHLFTLALWIQGGLFSVALSSDCSLWLLASDIPKGARTFLSHFSDRDRFFRPAPDIIITSLYISRKDFWKNLLEKIIINLISEHSYAKNL